MAGPLLVILLVGLVPRPHRGQSGTTSLAFPVP